MKRTLILALVCGCAASVSHATVFSEQAGTHNTQASAQLIAGIVGGDTIVGINASSSSTQRDFYQIRPAAQPLGIYRHTLTINTPTAAQHTGRLQGTGQAGGTDATIQTAVAGVRQNIWYGFGTGQDETYYAITGTSTTTQQYTVSYSMQQVTPRDLGSFQAGPMTFSTVGRTTADTEIVLYDNQFNVMRIHDDVLSLDGSGNQQPAQSEIIQTLGAGRYYFALSLWNVATADAHELVGEFNNKGGSNRSVFTPFICSANGNGLDPNTSLPFDMDFGITDLAGTHEFAATRDEAFGVLWNTFEVVPAPSGAALGLLALSLGARRRRR